MQIDVSLNSNSIDDIINLLNKRKQKIVSLMPQIIKECLYKIRDIANEKIMSIDIGTNLKSDLINSWEIVPDDIMPNAYILKNSQVKAVYIEFGVGIVGAHSPHPMANEGQIYRYNIPTVHKDENGVWSFYANRSDLDIPSNDILMKTSFKDKRERMLVSTAGSPAHMFLFNAYMDFIQGNYIEMILEKVKQNFWR